MAIERITIPAAAGRNEFRIYAELPNINHFLKTALTSDVAAGVSNKQVTVKATTRRQYPADPTPFNVPGTAREVLIDPSRKSGNGLPGRNFRLVMDAGTAGEENRQFTYVGRFIDLHAWLRTQAKAEIHLFGPNGTRYTIPMATTTP